MVYFLKLKTLIPLELILLRKVRIQLLLFFIKISILKSQFIDLILILF